MQSVERQSYGFPQAGAIACRVDDDDYDAAAAALSHFALVICFAPGGPNTGATKSMVVEPGKWGPPAFEKSQKRRCPYYLVCTVYTRINGSANLSNPCRQMANCDSPYLLNYPGNSIVTGQS